MTRRLSQDEGDERSKAKYAPPSTVHDVITGGVEGGVGVLALEPALAKVAGKVVENPFRAGWGKRLGVSSAVGAASTGLIGAGVSLFAKKRKERKQQRQMETLQPGMIEFKKKDLEEKIDEAVPRAKSKYRTAATVAGAGALGLGLTTLPGASKFFGIRGRASVKGLGFQATNEAGKMVADYIEGSQKLLNTGIKGKIAGHVIEKALAEPEGLAARVARKAVGGSTALGPRLATEHFARFRASPLSALHFWDFEHSLLHGNKIAKQDAAAKLAGRELSPKLLQARKTRQDEMHYAREATHKAIKEQIEVHGKNEMDALKHVAYNSTDSKVQHYFKELASTKVKAAEMYAKKSLISPGLAAAGGAGLLVGRKPSETPTDVVQKRGKAAIGLEGVIEDLIQFESDRQLRSGVRLDKYEKTIRAREIDRHLHDYLRSAALGTVAGAAIRGPASLKQRALIGAGGGTLVAGVLHAAGHRDPYGEQSEEAKITQAALPKYVGGAAILGGLLARFQRRRAAALAVMKAA